MSASDARHMVSIAGQLWCITSKHKKTGRSFPKASDIVLWSVTRNVSYDRLCQRYDFVPWCNPDFYAVRRAFFHRLDELQQDQVEKNTPPGGLLEGE